MREKDKTQNSGSDAAVSVDYAFWDVPGSAFKVVYSLPLFHEIDFVVNEGYRKIPHGGIEVGGLLFGSITAEQVRIEAFRPIECEHASGPTLNFSERDLAELENQITAPASDPELSNLKPVGWFLAHTRGPMEITEAEAQQFDRFFAGPSYLTVIVKPERFQPTRFGFLVRKADGRLPRDATATAVILPLPGRSHKAGQLIPSLLAPAPAVAKRPVQPPSTARPQRNQPANHRVVDEVTEDITDEELPAPAQRKVPETKLQRPADKNSSEPATPPLSIWKIPPEPELSEAEKVSGPGAEEQPDTRTPLEKEARRRLSRDRARVIEQAFPATEPFRPAALPSLPANSARQIPTSYDRYAPIPQEYTARHTDAENESVLNPRSITALAVAALLGCLVGYIAYLQLPAPVIPIDVRPINQMIVVSWPPAETRNAIYAAIRLNDGPPVPLSADEKREGQVSLTSSKDFKVEVMARNWVRDSRGMVRYLHSANGNGRVVPSVGALP